MSNSVTDPHPTRPANDDGALVQVSGLRISYEAGRELVPVVQDVDFNIAAGESFGLVGESGSGKSTVARTLLAELRAGSRILGGEVRVDGQNVFDLDGPALRKLRGGTVALVAQNAGQSLTPSMRVGKQVQEALESHGIKGGRRRVLELLDQVRLPHVAELAKRYPHQLSGGQQQRVSIAMAIAARPKVLVLDEPTTALDVVTQAAVLRLIEDLRSELNVAALIVSHDLGVVSGMADRVAVMRDGRILENQTTAGLFARPEQEYTRELLDSVPRIGAPVASIRAIQDEPLVEARSLTISYHPSAPPAVDGVDLTIRRGETLAVVGESGSGKSTMAWSLAGLTPASGGTMRLLDERVGQGGDLTQPVARRSTDLRRLVQLIFQNADTSLNPRRTVASAIRRPLRLFGTVPRKDERRRVEELLTEVDLPASFASRLPSQLSGGQRQRVGIARALAAEPDLIIADEITTALDVSVQAAILELLAELQKHRGLTTLFISHDLAVVKDVADRVVVMKNGRIVEEGPVESIFSGPNHPYTESLVDAVLEPGELDLPEPGPSEDSWEDHPDGDWDEPSPGHRIRNWKDKAVV
ncbi:ABC transporter ATP-binding protein [Arthrobacter tecti]